MSAATTIAALNARAAGRITAVVGTMACAWAFTALALLSAPAAFATGNLVVIVGWVSSNFLQLVLLPILMVGQARQQARHDEHAAKLDAIHAHLVGADR